MEKASKVSAPRVFAALSHHCWLASAAAFQCVGSAGFHQSAGSVQPAVPEAAWAERRGAVPVPRHGGARAEVGRRLGAVAAADVVAGDGEAEAVRAEEVVGELGAFGLRPPAGDVGEPGEGGSPALERLLLVAGVEPDGDVRGGFVGEGRRGAQRVEPPGPRRR